MILGLGPMKLGLFLREQARLVTVVHLWSQKGVRRDPRFVTKSALISSCPMNFQLLQTTHVKMYFRHLIDKY